MTAVLHSAAGERNVLGTNNDNRTEKNLRQGMISGSLRLSDVSQRGSE